MNTPVNVPANSNTLSPIAPIVPAVIRQLESDVRYQLRRAPFGLTLGDLQDNLNEDGSRQSSFLSVQMAVERLVEAGDAEMQRRGELDYVVAATPAHRRPPPKGALVHRAIPRPLGPVAHPVRMKPELARRLANPALASETWDGLDAAPGADHSLDAAAGVLLAMAVGGLLMLAAAVAVWGGWL